ncbi:MAG: ECF transporter S component [Ruminococcus sp.]|nr:ECF transporter S component [Ruminococcus sp.]
MKNTKTIVGIGLMTALVVVLSIISMNIKFGPFTITLALTPIVVGAALYGWKAGGWLGFVFGCMTLFDAAAFLAVNVPLTVILCILKGTLAGIAAGLVYKAVNKKNHIVAAIAAAITAPVVNTGVFLLGCTVFFLDTVKAWGEAAGFKNVLSYFIVGFVGINFLVELGVSIVLISAVIRIIDLAPKKARA